MKTIFIVSVAVILVCGCFCPLTVYGNEADSPRYPVIGAEDLSRWSIRVDGEYGERQITFDNADQDVLEYLGACLLLSYDVLPFLSVNTGMGDVLGGMNVDGALDDSGLMWKIGFKLNLWEHDVVDPTFLECRIRFRTSFAYSDYTIERDEIDLEWAEWFGTFTVSLEFFVDDHGRNLSVYPYSILYYVGPVYSDLADASDFPGSLVDRSNDGADSIDERDDVGLLAGIDLYLSHNFCIGWQGRFYDGGDPVHVGSMTFHF